jgi:branched-chain amino acid transport system substrate-binding protein
MRLAKVLPVAFVGAALLVLGTAGVTGAARTTRAAGTPIVIGAAIDLTKNMAPFDAPAMTAAQIEIDKINAAGGVDGHPLKLKVINDQLDPQQTKEAATKLISQGASIGWVTCDVDYATPAVQTFLQAKMLTVAPCIGTDQMGPSRFGSAGDLAFSFGNAAQDEGSAMAEWAYQHGWHSADVVTDKLLVYFQNVCTAFTNRFKQLGGTIVDSESFKQGDQTINNVATRINGKKADMIAFCTSFAGDQPAFVSALRTLGNKTPIMNSWAGDGAYWWPKSPKVTNYYFVTYAAAVAKDPDPAVRAFEAKMAALGPKAAAQTGGFITGADAIDAIAYAIKKNGGSTDGAKLASTLSHLAKFKTLGGPITFTPTFHSVTGRPYRIVVVNNNVAKVVGEHTTKVVATIH